VSVQDLKKIKKINFFTTPATRDNDIVINVFIIVTNGVCVGNRRRLRHS